MTQRLDYKQASPKGFAAMLGLEQHARSSGLDHALLELVKTRVSQINGCAFCLHMHAADARKLGETQERLDVLGAWREAGCFSPREQAAILWTEALTEIARHEAHDAAYEAVAASFSEAEIAGLTAAILAINGWNRLAIGFKMAPRFASAP